MEGLKDDATTKEDIKAAFMEFNVEVDFEFTEFQKGHYAKFGEKYAVKKGHYVRFLETNVAINLAAKITEKSGSKLKIKKVDIDFRVLEGQEEINYLREERKRLRKDRDLNHPWYDTNLHNLGKKVQAAQRKYKRTSANPEAGLDEIQEKYDTYISLKKDYKYSVRKSKRAFAGPRETGLAVKKSSVQHEIDGNHFSLM